MSFCYCSYSPPVFASTPGLAFRMLDLTCVTNWPRVSNLYCQLGQGHSATSSKLCNWLFLMCLVSAINHLHPECWATFGKSSFERKLVYKFGITKNIFRCFDSDYTYLLTNDTCNMILTGFLFVLLYVSNGVVSLPSTLVLYYPIDVVLSLSLITLKRLPVETNILYIYHLIFRLIVTRGRLCNWCLRIIGCLSYILNVSSSFWLVQQGT